MSQERTADGRRTDIVTLSPGNVHYRPQTALIPALSNERAWQIIGLLLYAGRMRAIDIENYFGNDGNAFLENGGNIYDQRQGDVFINNAFRRDHGMPLLLDVLPKRPKPQQEVIVQTGLGERINLWLDGAEERNRRKYAPLRAEERYLKERKTLNSFMAPLIELYGERRINQAIDQFNDARDKGATPETAFEIFEKNLGRSETTMDVLDAFKAILFDYLTAREVAIELGVDIVNKYETNRLNYVEQTMLEKRLKSAESATRKQFGEISKFTDLLSLQEAKIQFIAAINEGASFEEAFTIFEASIRISDQHRDVIAPFKLALGNYMAARHESLSYGLNPVTSLDQLFQKEQSWQERLFSEWRN